MAGKCDICHEPITEGHSHILPASVCGTPHDIKVTYGPKLSEAGAGEVMSKQEIIEKITADGMSKLTLRDLSQLYDAGYRAGIEDAAKKADEMAALDRDFARRFTDNGQDKMVNRAIANAAEAQRVAAEIRKLGDV